MNYLDRRPTTQDQYFGPSIQTAQSNAFPEAPPPNAPRFDLLASAFANMPANLAKAMYRIRSLADRYGGSTPEAVGKESGSAEPNSVVARMEQSASQLESLINQLHAQIDRLERF